jgi:hypothetical protein
MIGDSRIPANVYRKLAGRDQIWDSAVRPPDELADL